MTDSMASEQKAITTDERILVCVGDDRKASDLTKVLERKGFSAETVCDFDQCVRAIAEGAGAVVVSDEVLQEAGIGALERLAADQPAWSDLPMIVVTTGAASPEVLGELASGQTSGNLLFLDLPVSDSWLEHALRNALRTRRRQYDVRDLLEQRQAILTSVQDPFVLLDHDFRFVYVNERSVEARGRPVEELLGRVKWEVFPELIGSPYHDALLEAKEKNVQRRIEYRDPISGRWYERRIYPSRAGFSVIGSDITERREAVDALRRSEERFRLIVESTIEYAIFTMDHGLRIQSWNSGAERLLGYKEEEILGQSIDIIFTAEDRRKNIPDAESGRARVEGGADDERWYVRKDGSRFWASGQTSPLKCEDGEILGYVKILRDYTGRKRAETWLRALNETLEKRIAERTAEAEQRATQLQMLAGQLTEVEERERRRLAELLHDHLQQILVAAKMQVGMLSHSAENESLNEGLKRIDDLLERSIEASRSLTVELSPPILYDAGLGPAFAWLARRMHDDHGLEVTVEGEEEVGPEVETLRAFLFQAVRELLFNIVKHARVKTAKVTLERDDGTIEVCVSDGGIGFDPEQLRVKQAANAGFGLFSIEERLELLGGTMNLDTAPGNGTMVRIRVRQHAASAAVAGVSEPPALGAKREGETVEESPSGQGKIRILLADDHKILREGLAGLLREQPDFDVISEASDGQMAVDLARETEPDVIVMDVSMPRLNGVEATRIIMKEMPRIRIVG
ncbi:MAG TPA: PAS domain S-box protein, partial [Opitutales bacterium]|nr:PAS domain S-box protein [Opitutales bacterium]